VSRKLSNSSHRSVSNSFLLDGLRTGRLNYPAIVAGALVALYVGITIIRPLFASTRPGKVTQDFGCVSKSSMNDCATTAPQ
jgi:hypothetical protein